MITNSVALKDSYKIYKQNSNNPVSSKLYLKIIGEFMKFIMKKVFEGFEVKLADKLGVIGVRGRKAKPVINKDGEIKGIAPNWAKTKQIWIEAAQAKGMTFKEYLNAVPREERPPMAYCFNEHSNGNIYNIYWYKNNIIVLNRHLYNLRFSWSNKRELSRLIKYGKEYIISENIT